MNSIKNLGVVLLALKLTNIAEPSWILIILIFIIGWTYQFIKTMTGANGVIEQVKRELAMIHLRRVARKAREEALREQKVNQN